MLHMNNTKYKKLCHDWCHSCIGQKLHKPFDAAAASHLHMKLLPVSPSRLQVARQSYILGVSHIHLCDWRRSLIAAECSRHHASRIVC